ncbi:MAG: alpha/beta hydrolase-fold protein [Planctomycetaceae bacterium]|nr:alpha/beta hydrolase-fold protein [Planctomycetaceae bacterium]
MQRQAVWTGVAWLCGMAFWCGGAVPASAQQFVERVYRDDAGSHKYQVFVPAGYSPNRPAPALLFLHGAGERGTDGRLQTQVGLGPYVKARGAAFPFLAIFPQAEDIRGRLLTPWTEGQPDAERALKILDEVQRTYAVDSRRIALVGWSMGGYGAWSLGAAHPEKWSAVVAISGGGDPAQVAALKGTPVWAFHGARDAIVPVTESQKIVEALQAAGGTVAYNEFPDAGHEISRETFGNDGFLAWLVDSRRPAQLSATSVPLKIEPPPFVPALELPHSAGVRLGNEALSALAEAAPQLVPANMLTGRLNDMFDSTSAQGRSFSVRFSGISYTGRLERVVIKATGNDRVLMQLGLRNITLSIGGTSVNGARHSASAGPITIGIGHNQPVWLAMEVAPYVENRRLRLRLLGANFSIPPESYYVTQPAGVSVRGLGMTQDRVVSGLVSGLYGARGRVENEVRAIAPNIVRQMEDQLTFVDPSPIVAGFWPLPVYQPRLRAYPESVKTDANGISLVLGMTAAAFVPGTTSGSPPVAPAKVTLDSLSSGTNLQVSLAPQVLSPLSELLIQSDLARINLLDIPEPSFARFVDRAAMTEILPDLERFPDGTDLRAELVLTQPLAVQSGTSTTADSAVSLKLQLPGVRIDIATREPGATSKWQPYAQFPLNVADDVTAALEKPRHDRRLLGLDWGEGATITGTGRFATGVEPTNAAINTERFVAMFRESWSKWTARGASATPVADLMFGTTKLRLQTLTGESATLTAGFDIPTIKLANLAEAEFVYETRGPRSGWGGPYTLSPGKTQEFVLTYPLTYRHRGPNGVEEYTLDVGSHSEFRVPVRGGPPRLFEARAAAD